MALSKFISVSALAATALTGLMFAAPARAQEDPITLSANVSFVSDYRFRGVSLSDRRPAIQGGMDAEMAINENIGIFLGTWGSSLDTGMGDGEFEFDVYGGVKGTYSDVKWSVGAIGYIYPYGANSDYYEVFGTLGYNFGFVDTTFGVNYAPDQNNYGGDGIYAYVDGAFAIPETPFSIDAHVGYEDANFTPSDGKWDWSLGGSVAYKNFKLGVAYVDTDINNFVSDAGVVVTLGASF